MKEKGRRGAGEGSVYELPNGRWRGVVDLGWHGGKRRRRYVTRLTQAEVIREVRRLSTLADQGRLHPGKTPTLAEWFDTYFAEVAAQSVRPSTLHQYRQEVRLHIGPELGRHRLDKLRPAHLTAFYRAQGERLAPGSVRRLHALLRRALNIAVRWQLLPVNPATLVEPPSLKRAEVNPWTIAEARTFLGLIVGSRLEARWQLAISVGMRQGEVLGLSWSDVDLDQGVIRIRQALRRQPDGSLRLVEPKTARSRRRVPIPEPVVEALKRHRERQAVDPIAPDATWTAADLVFTTSAGTPIHPRNDYRSFRVLVEQSGMRRVRLHDLRHTAASTLITRGVPARVVMEMLGHSQISVTMDTYGHVAPEVARVAADSVQEALWG